MAVTIFPSSRMSHSHELLDKSEGKENARRDGRSLGLVQDEKCEEDKLAHCIGSTRHLTPGSLVYHPTPRGVTPKVATPDSRASASRLYRRIRMLDRLPLFSYNRP